MTDSVECVVVGAGVVGLAIARALALQGHEVIVLEAENAFGTHTSSRNSEVVHAGIAPPSVKVMRRSRPPTASMSTPANDLVPFPARVKVEVVRPGIDPVADDNGMLPLLAVNTPNRSCRCRGCLPLQLTRTCIESIKPVIGLVGNII